ncbi:rna binding protein [Moniliophthora roreri MCA 2997]|uniref:Rna binding protein n=1 Tax=Moniliophthora roreri (strain MCA 2997) TaxID=1381753 RepID=V2WKZ4_MONRO|nr:rna binding protein [Moniliophthora roreri MCA 2997]
MGQRLIEGTNKLLLYILKQLVALELKEDSEEFKEMIWTSLPNTQPDHLNTAIHALNTCQLTNFSFSPKELLFGMVVNTKKTLLKEAAPILKEMDITTHMAYIAQQQLDGYDRMVRHTIRHKNTFDKRVIWESGKEIVFEAGDLVQVYRSNMDHTFKTERKLIPKWSAPRRVVKRNVNSYMLETLEGVWMEGEFSARRLRLFKKKPEERQEIEIESEQVGSGEADLEVTRTPPSFKVGAHGVEDIR